MKRDDYSYEQRLSVALLYLVSQFARRLLNGMDRRLPKAIFLDEAWAITSTPQGAKLIPEVSRMGRSRNTALILVSQNAGDLLNEQVTNCISGVFAFRSSERAEVANVMALLGIEPSDEHKAVLRGLGNGECIFRDLDGRAGRVGIDLISDDLRQWLDTNPTRARPDDGCHGTSGRPSQLTCRSWPALGPGQPGGCSAWPVSADRRASALTTKRYPPGAPPMLRPRRIPCLIALLLAVVAILLGVPRAAHQAPRQDAARPAGRRDHAGGAVTGGAPAGSARYPVSATSADCSGSARWGQSGLTGDLNNICQPSLPSPELASSGIDSLARPVVAPGPQNGTLYDNYGTSGDFWAATKLQCSDMTSLIGNNVASMVFDIAKSIDRVIISVYQSAASEGILSWLTNVVDKLISSLGNAIYFPYLAIVVIFGAIWLAWQGLIRKRGTRTIEGTIWMVVACAAAIWLIGRPADFTGLGRSVSDGISQTLNVAFSKLPSPGQSNCLPVQRSDPQVKAVTYNLRLGKRNRRPERQRVVDGARLQAMAGWRVRHHRLRHVTRRPADTGEHLRAGNCCGRRPSPINEKPTAALIQAKQATYSGIATASSRMIRASIRCSRASNGRRGWRSHSSPCSQRWSPASSYC